jgi:hypothetical protein
MTNAQSKHSFYLEELVERLSEIGECKKQIEWLALEPIWYKYNSYEQDKMCDIIGAYENGIAFAWELKGNYKKKAKAIVQVNQGERFLKEVMNYEQVIKKFIIYSRKGYEYHIIK